MFGAATAQMHDDFNAAITLAIADGNTTFYSWCASNKNARIFAVECDKCGAMCFFEWTKQTTPEDKSGAVAWFIAFLFQGAISSMEQSDGKFPLCARLGKGLFGRNGIAGDEEDTDGDDAVMES